MRNEKYTGFSQEPVVVAPVVGLSDEGAGDEGLHQQVDVQVGNLSQDVVVAVDVLLGNKNTLWKKKARKKINQGNSLEIGEIKILLKSIL